MQTSVPLAGTAVLLQLPGVFQSRVPAPPVQLTQLAAEAAGAHDRQPAIMALAIARNPVMNRNRKSLEKDIRVIGASRQSGPPPDDPVALQCCTNASQVNTPNIEDRARQSPASTGSIAAAALCSVSGTRGERKLENEHIDVFRVAGGRVVEMWSTTLDPYVEDEFWA